MGATSRDRSERRRDESTGRGRYAAGGIQAALRGLRLGPLACWASRRAEHEREWTACQAKIHLDPPASQSRAIAGEDVWFLVRCDAQRKVGAGGVLSLPTMGSVKPFWNWGMAEDVTKER